MSNVKLLIVGDADVGLKYAPQGIWAANKMRIDGHGHGEARSFPFGDILLRVILDDYAGDKCYIHTETSCPSIEYNGFLDTFPSLQAYLMGQPLRAQELQEDIEDLPRERNGEWLEGNPKMYGIRKFPAYDISKDPVPSLPPGYTLKSTTYPKVSVERQTADDGFRNFFAEHKPTKYTGLMRRVLQCTFGTRAWMDALTFKVAPEAPRQFVVNYKFGDSWGVILAPGKDGSLGNHYFLIRITSGEVFWVPASFCVHKVKVGATDVYAPVLKLVQRAGAISLGTIEYVGASQHEVIGWSFSYTEPKASVVLYDERGADEGHWTYTSLATITVDFESGVPVSVSFEQEGQKHLWRPSEEASRVHGLGYDVAGNLCVATVKIAGINNPTDKTISAPTYTFYKPDGSQEVIRFCYSESEATTETYSPASPLYYRISVFSFTVPTYYYDIANITEAITSGSGSTTTAAEAHPFFVTAAHSTPVSTNTVSDSKTTYSLFHEEAINTVGGSLYNNPRDTLGARVQFGFGTVNVIHYAEYKVSLFQRKTGTNVTTEVAAHNAAVVIFPDDREVVAITYDVTFNVETVSATYSPYTAVHYTSGGRCYYGTPGGDARDKFCGIPQAPSEYNASCTGAFPGVSFNIQPVLRHGISLDSAGISPAPDGYYSGSFLSYVPGTAFPTDVINIYPDACLFPQYTAATVSTYTAFPSIPTSKTGTRTRKALLLTGDGDIDVSSDTNFLDNCLRFWDPQKENQTWIPEVVTSAYQPSDFYTRKHETGKGKIVILGDKEYNAENSLYGFIGVV